MTALDFGGKRNELHADSNGYGVAADPLSMRWASLICSERNGQDYNYSSPGQTLEHIGSNFMNKEDISQFDNSQAYLWIAEGTNDVRNTGCTVAGFKAQLLENIDYAVNTKGWSYSKIVLPTINFMIDYGSIGSLARLIAYNQAIKEVAILRNTIFLDLYTFFNGLSNKTDLLISDGLHLNNAGHRQAANFYEAADYTPINDIGTTPTDPNPGTDELFIPYGNYYIAA